MSVAPKFAQLEEMTDDQIRERYDAEVAGRQAINTEFYLNELARRQALRIEAEGVEVARRALWLTVVVTVATLLNVALVAVTVF